MGGIGIEVLTAGANVWPVTDCDSVPEFDSPLYVTASMARSPKKQVTE